MASIVDTDAVSALRESVDALIFEIAEQTDENQYKADALRYRMLLRYIRDMSIDVQRDYIRGDFINGASDLRMGISNASVEVRISVPVFDRPTTNLDALLDSLIGDNPPSSEERPHWFEDRYYRGLR